MNIKQNIVRCIEKSVPDVLAIYQFGSAGTEHERPDSDVDIAILPNKPLSSKKYLSLVNELIVATQRDHIDLVDLSAASTIIIFQIITQGRRIYCKDSNACEAFESLEFSKYVRLNEMRAGILNDIRKRGSVYGQ